MDNYIILFNNLWRCRFIDFIIFKMRLLMEDKRGNVLLVLWFITFIFIILFVGVLIALSVSITDYVFDTVTPEFNNLGMVDTFNASQASQFTITPVNTIVQNFSWMGGTLYFLMLIGIFGFTMIIRTTPSRWLIGFYFLLMVLLIVGAILMSNIYQGFYEGIDEIAIRLQEQTLLSFLILHSPLIFTVMGFFGGIIIFSGIGEEENR